MSHTHLPGGGLPLLLVGVVMAGYEVLALRVREWPSWRGLAFVTGCALLAVGLTPAALPWPAGDFRSHMSAHLLVGMLAPLGLVLGAPMTLLLRTLPRRAGRRIGRLLRSRPVHVIAHPVVALVLSLGGLVLVLPAGMHPLVQLHFLLAGYLFAWVVAGPDPAPRRLSVPARLVVLGVAVAVHSIVAQLIYAGVLVDLPLPREQREGGAELMYYGGDIAEVLLAVALTTRRRTRAVKERAPVTERGPVKDREPVTERGPVRGRKPVRG
ncbi:cytochrome c oxidase assembly protein [Actinoplanes philippinensis]|uniref:cytochrome c oxidase assembly protein n=1 Tax=Actinoplanes philippinensis TaxID=35752 RepID=UPI0033EDF94E